MEKDFNIEELIRTIDMIRRNSAPGRDGIVYRMIKELSEIMKKELLRLYMKVEHTTQGLTRLTSSIYR